MRFGLKNLRMNDSQNISCSDTNIWRKRYKYFHSLDARYLRFLVGDRARVLELGCGTGQLLNEVGSDESVGVDKDALVVDQAKDLHPHLSFIVGEVEDVDFLMGLKAYGKFDVILLDNTLGYVTDIQKFLRSLHCLLTSSGRVISAYHSPIWEPMLKFGERRNWKKRTPALSSLNTEDIENLCELEEFEIVKREWRILSPLRLGGLGSLVNGIFGPLPGIRRLSVRHYVVARSKKTEPFPIDKGISVVVPCKNEQGNIQNLVSRIPEMGCPIEVIFVEGGSKDHTWEEILSVQESVNSIKVTALRQPGSGKADAVRHGFANARGDIFVILDADLTVRPEDLEKFVELLVSGKAEYINGTRRVYRMDSGAMQVLNRVANLLFARVFSYLINQRLTDTLCGTKAIHAINYARIQSKVNEFNALDPFGDFDLILGAARLNLRIMEVPIRYESRKYGTTQISRFSDSVPLFRIVWRAYVSLKLI